jgi:hypothetical protein
MMVSGIVAARKYHHFSETWNCWLPVLSSWKLKNVMLKTACELLVMNCYDQQESLTEMNVPGRKNMVTAAMVIMDELSL